MVLEVLQVPLDCAKAREKLRRAPVVLLTALTGRKQLFIFPPSEERLLEERPELQLSEYGDRVFTKEPRAAIASGARAAVGTVGPGEIVYIPANTIHVVDNLEDIIAVALHFPLPWSHSGRVEERVRGGSRRYWYAHALPSTRHTPSWTHRLAESVMAGSVLRDVFRRQAVAPYS